MKFTNYTKMIEPIGYKARERNESFSAEKAKLINRFTRDFIDEYCDEEGEISWDEIIRFNSGNLTDEGRQKFHGWL